VSIVKFPVLKVPRLKLRIHWIVIAVTLVCGADAFCGEALSRGDAAWAKRAESFHETGGLDEKQVRIALAAYEEALQQDPGNLSIHFKLMDALYYMNFFLAENKSERRLLADRAIELNESALRVLEQRVGPEKLSAAATLAERAKILKQDAQAVHVHFWCSINWGLWAMAHGNLASARKNVAGKIREHATLVILLDDQIWDGGGYRLLGRLHTDTPIVPVFTGWIEPAAGMELLRKANKISTRDPRNPLFLAEGILKFEPEHEDEAILLLEELSSRSPGDKRPVEEAYYIREARRVLEKAERRRAQRAS
jgi:tetratricopeptide (TPR) repeat protein